MKSQHKKLLAGIITFKPYKGGGGPEPSQTEKNTLCLKQELDKLGIENTLDYDYAKDLWDGDEVQISITRDKKTVVIGYDRWGFCVDGGRKVAEYLDLDQAGLEETVNAIKGWFKVK